MAIQLSDVANVLQKVIMPYIQDNVPKQTPFLDQVKRDGEVTFINNNFYAPVRTSRHSGVTALANDTSSTRSGSSSLGQASVGVKILTGAFDITKLTIDATKTTKGAVENMLTKQAEFLVSDFAKHINRQMFSDGYGVLAQVSTQGTTAITVTNPNSSLDDTRSIDWYGSVNGDISPVEYISQGQILAIGSGAVALGTVSSVSGTTITFTTAVVGSANQAVYLVDGDGGGAGTAEIQGVRLALSSTTGTSTYAGVARSTLGWTPQFGSASEALSLTKMEQRYLSAKKYAQIGDKYAIFVNTTLYKKYGDLLTSLRRTVNETDLLGGWTGLEFAAGAGKVGVFLDYDVPDGEVLIINMDTWYLCQVSDMNWMENPNEGSMLRLANKIQYQATMVWFANLLCVAPGANGRETQKTG